MNALDNWIDMLKSLFIVLARIDQANYKDAERMAAQVVSLNNSLRRVNIKLGELIVTPAAVDFLAGLRSVDGVQWLREISRLKFPPGNTFYIFNEELLYKAASKPHQIILDCQADALVLVYAPYSGWSKQRLSAYPYVNLDKSSGKWTISRHGKMIGL